MNEIRMASIELAAHEWGVERTQEGYGLGIVAAHDHTVRTHEILDRRPFLQELRVRDYGNVMRGTLADERLDPLGRTHGHGRFCHDHLCIIHVAANCSRGFLDRRKIGFAVGPRRSPDG
jgi:hypothetical protein